MWGELTWWKPLETAKYEDEKTQLVGGHAKQLLKWTEVKKVSGTWLWEKRDQRTPGWCLLSDVWNIRWQRSRSICCIHLAGCPLSLKWGFLSILYARNVPAFARLFEVIKMSSVQSQIQEITQILVWLMLVGSWGNLLSHWSGGICNERENRPYFKQISKEGQNLDCMGKSDN